MALIDWLVILGYFALLACVVVFTKRKQETSADFFLGGRSVGWLAIGASIFAANIGSEHLIGLAGSGAVAGLSQSHWEFHAWVLILMSWNGCFLTWFPLVVSRATTVSVSFSAVSSMSVPVPSSR